MNASAIRNVTGGNSTIKFIKPQVQKYLVR